MMQKDQGDKNFLSSISPAAALLIATLFLISGIVLSCSSHRPKVGDWYKRRQGNQAEVQIKYLGTGEKIVSKAQEKRYRTILGASEFAHDECFAYEDSQQVLWEKLRFLNIEPLDALDSQYTKVTNHP